MEEKKEEKKVKKPKEKKAKEPEIDLFNTPVYELTEDQIIKKGLKTKNPKDKMCYLGIVICFIFIFIPPIFDKVFDYTRPEDTHVEVVYSRLSCRKVLGGSNRLILNVYNEYKDSIVTKSTLVYTYDESADGQSDLNELENWYVYENEKGFKFEKGKENDKNIVTITIDYKNHEELRSKEDLTNYSMNFMPQFNHFGSQGFFCTKDSKSVTEDTAHPEDNKENVWEEE